MTTAAILEPACPPGTDPTLAVPLPFDPDKRTLHAILQRLISPDYDLADIASCFRITLMDLLDWLERPDVAHLVKRLERHIRRKARLAARASSPLVIRSLRRTLNAFQRDDDAEQARLADRASSDADTRDADPRDRDRVIRTREAVRKAAALLERIAKAPAPRRSSAKRNSDRRSLRSSARAAEAPQLSSAPSTPAAPPPNKPAHEHPAAPEEVAPQTQPAHVTADIHTPAPQAHDAQCNTPPPGVTPAPGPENPDTAPT